MYAATPSGHAMGVASPSGSIEDFDPHSDFVEDFAPSWALFTVAVALFSCSMMEVMPPSGHAEEITLPYCIMEDIMSPASYMRDDEPGQLTDHYQLIQAVQEPLLIVFHSSGATHKGRGWFLSLPFL